MLPYCDEFDWGCFRGLVLGVVALLTLTAAGMALRRIAPIALQGGNTGFRQHLVMISLATLQMWILVVHCLVVRSPQLLYCEKYVRGTQIILACLLYGNLAAEMLDRKRLFYRCLASMIGIVFLVMTTNVVVMLSEGDSVDCHHLSWLLMSICCTIVSASFAICGKIIIDNIKAASTVQHKVLLGTGPQKELEQTHLQLWILLVVNCFSSTLQLLLDLYIAWIVVGSKTCTSMFFDDENVALEQLVRLSLAFCGFILPEWATLYVFYWIPRHQFATHLDIPEIDIGYYSF